MDNQLIKNEDWDVLTQFFPPGWRQLASETNALTRLRGFDSPDALLRVLLIHIARGYSLRETVVIAKTAGIADVSDVALLKRLRNAEEWLKELCRALFRERSSEISGTNTNRFNLRLIDSTHVKEPGKTGSQWRIHFSIRFPSLECDHFELTPVIGAGTGETFERLPVSSDDLILGDRAYSTAAGIEHLDDQKAFSLVRINTGGIALRQKNGKRFPLLKRVRSIRKANEVGEWPAGVIGPSGRYIPGRICVIRKNEIATQKAQKKLRQKETRRGEKLRPRTLEYARYVILFTTIPKQEMKAREILTWYRIRWQIELVFKRFKSIANLGHLPKRDDVSSRAWLYGKLFISLLTMKLIRYAEDFSPWGYA